MCSILELWPLCQGCWWGHTSYSVTSSSLKFGLMKKNIFIFVLKNNCLFINKTGKNLDKLRFDFMCRLPDNIIPVPEEFLVFMFL